MAYGRAKKRKELGKRTPAAGIPVVPLTPMNVIPIAL
jgi:hypothetical protein